MSFQSKAKDTLKGMYPGSFALVMATGIVSIAVRRLGFEAPARVMLWLNLGLFVTLWGMLGVRIALFGKTVLADMGDHWKGAGFFTIPAACAVLGVQWLEFGGPSGLAVGLWWLTLVCWFVFTVAFYCAMIIGENQVDIHYAINGAWLTSVVATQGLSVLASTLAAKGIIDTELGFFGSLFFAGAGSLLYLMLIASIFYRLVVHHVRAPDFSAPYWVNMGAAMITSLALSKAALIAAPEVQGTLKLFGTVIWSFGVWWIPVLITLGFWRHGIKRLPLTYDPRLWSLVFPLGMFTVSTLTLGQVWGWEGFLRIAGCAGGVAAFAWSLVMLGLAKATLRWLLA